MFPIIYIILKNTFIFAYVSIAHQNAPKEVNPIELFEKANKGIYGPSSGVNILPGTPIVKKEVDTSIFGMRGDQDGALQTTLSTPPTMPSVSTPIDQIETWTGGPTGSGGINPIESNNLDSYFQDLTR